MDGSQPSPLDIPRVTGDAATQPYEAPHAAWEAARRLVDAYPVVSFDVFDTLLSRRVARPEHVFEAVGREAGLPRFRARRIAAEAEARRRREARHGDTEVLLPDIHAALRLDAPPDGRLMQREI